MKKNFLSLLGITMIVLFSVFSLTLSNKEPQSDFQLKNLIAMSSAQAEGVGGGPVCCAMVSQMVCTTMIYPFYMVYYGYPYLC